MWRARLEREEVEKLSLTPFDVVCEASLLADGRFGDGEGYDEKTPRMLCSENPSAFLLMRNEREGRLTATRDIPPSSMEK